MPNASRHKAAEKKKAPRVGALAPGLFRVSGPAQMRLGRVNLTKAVCLITNHPLGMKSPSLTD
jgi:hypothetical protein